MTGPPQERGSTRPVTIEGDPDGRTYYCEVRTLPGSGLKPDDIVWIELGATWAIVGGRKERVGGQWRQAVVMQSQSGMPSDVHVRLSPNPATAPPELG
ncbi:MAG: hypothetical protein Q8O42_09675 [Acidobacteriota bacterium]|nr:hypothetical protein [Acidobacteriota bacterium]